MEGWQEVFKKVIANADTEDPKDTINAIVDLSLKFVEEEAIFEKNTWLTDYRSVLTQIYQRYIGKMERDELVRLTSTEAFGSRLFSELASEEALMAYDRVSGMFDFVDFSQCRKFVLVGSGQLPMTALHVNDRTSVSEVLCVDVSLEAILALKKLHRSISGLRLDALQCDGDNYDYSEADIVYIANMVSPKSSVLERVVESAPEHVQIIVRVPYSFGRLWAEDLDFKREYGLEITGRSAGSRYLSRDIYFKRQPELVAD